jgi:hypothetical protein
LEEGWVDFSFTEKIYQINSNQLGFPRFFHMFPRKMWTYRHFPGAMRRDVGLDHTASFGGALALLARTIFFFWMLKNQRFTAIP